MKFFLRGVKQALPLSNDGYLTLLSALSFHAAQGLSSVAKLAVEVTPHVSLFA